jgi:hypothetical protein
LSSILLGLFLGQKRVLESVLRKLQYLALSESKVSQTAHLKPSYSRPGAVFILLAGATAHAAGTIDKSVADDGQAALTHYHMSPFRHGDAPGSGLVRSFRQLTAGPAEGRRGHRFSLTTVGACPDGAVHAVQGNQPPAGVADRYANLYVQFFGMGDRPFDDAICFRQGYGHETPP